MKKKLNVESTIADLERSSLFFYPKTEPDKSPTIDTPAPTDAQSTQTPLPTSPKASTKPRNLGTYKPRNLGSYESRSLETYDSRKLGTTPTTQDSAALPQKSGQPFDINDQAQIQGNFEFTQGELWALEDLKTELDRKHGMRIPKHDIIRAALHTIIEDYRANAEGSDLIKRLKRKKNS